ncbi:MAG: hypothetical protein LPK45_05680, partial [Bacteroidota bacterium]|nr:hypothetical protein [Bacteroidota bacterium]MDX5430559.1 hypothetical protein [Bacteroidota bacterium]MDX5469311.1 hypothetical protein [Bacteroidota bacterium]
MKSAFHFLSQHASRFFWVLAFLLLVWTGVIRYLLHEPDGMHFIRQTDGLSFVMGYAQFDAPFFEPRVYNLLGKEGKAASEFPLF